MGGVFSCISEAVEPLPKGNYDLTPIQLKSPPIVWVVGGPGSGRNVQVMKMSENLCYEDIKIDDLIREEAQSDSDRGKIIKAAFSNYNRKIPDTVVVDLIKEEMLKRCSTASGYILNNFPRTAKQGELFVDEIADVDCFIYLIADTATMLERIKSNSQEPFDEDAIKKSINSYHKQVKETLSKFSLKIEKINTNGPADDVYKQIEETVKTKVNQKAKITKESDYAQINQN